MSAKKSIDLTVLTVAVLGSLVLVNLLGITLFGRLDLTADDRFTLSDATRETLEGLSDPLTIRAYFTEDLPPPFSSTRRDVRDLLEEYYAAARGNVRYEFIDPVAEETEEDKEKKAEVKRDIFGRAVREMTSVEKELEQLGIPPVQVQINKDDKFEERRGYMGLVVSYGDKKEVIPVVKDVASLEYDLTTMVRKVSRLKAPKVAIVGGHDGPDQSKGLSRVYGLLQQLYDVTSVDLTQNPEIPEDVDALFVVGPATPFTEPEQRAIDQFVMSGRSAAFLLGEIEPDLQTMQSKTLNHGLGAMLETWGVRIEPGLVLDAECAPMTVAQQRGFMVVQQQVKYPFVPVPKALEADHPLTRGLARVSFPFMSPLTLTLPEGSAVKGDVLVKTSDNSWLQNAPYDFNPLQRWTLDPATKKGPQNLVVTLAGPLPSHFVKGAEETASSVDPAAGIPQAANARVLVAGGHSMVLDTFASQGNEALVLNLMDWLLQDEALLAVRSRGLGAAPIEKISDGKRNAAKYLNIVGLPLLFAGFGLVRWRMREARRSRVSL